MGQGATVRFCELLMYLLLLYILGKYRIEPQSYWTHCKTDLISMGSYSHTLTAGPLWKFESPVVSMSLETVSTSPWKVWIFPFSCSGQWCQVSFGEDWGQIHSVDLWLHCRRLLKENPTPPPQLHPPSQGILGLWVQTLGKFWFSTMILPTRPRIFLQIYVKQYLNSLYMYCRHRDPMIS